MNLFGGGKNREENIGFFNNVLNRYGHQPMYIFTNILYFDDEDIGYEKLYAYCRNKNT